MALNRSLGYSHAPGAPSHLLTSSSSSTEASVVSSWTETAYDWLQRSKRKRVEQEIPKDPLSAAWRFTRPLPSIIDGGGTGVAFVDTALRRQMPDRLPVVDIRGEAGSGKTWTVITLAARFVAATRPSKFEIALQQDSMLPRVILLDSQFDVTTAKLAYAVRSTLLMQSSNHQSDNILQQEMESCLGRIHVATVCCVTDWVAVLESIRNELASLQTSSSSDHPPTLVLWDGFLSGPTNEAQRTEVIRQLARLLHDCSVLFVATASTSSRRYEWEKYITHRIRLEKEPFPPSSTGHGYAATVHGSRIPFSISLAGILS